MKYEKGSFTIVPNKHVLAGLDAHAQVVYYWLCDFADSDGTCFPSRALLAQKANISMSTVDKALAILEGTGLLTKTKRYYEQAPTTNLYQLNLVKGGSVLGTLGSFQNTQGVASVGPTELNPVLTQQDTELEIREVFEDEDKPKRKERITGPKKDAYLSMVRWAEAERGFPFLSGSITRQFAALKEAKDNKLQSVQLKERWQEMGEDKFWGDKGYDWMDVVKSFNKKQ